MAYTVRSFESPKAAGETLYAARAVDIENAPIRTKHGQSQRPP